MEGMLCTVGAPAVLPVEVAGRSCEALLDTGASRSFINPRLVEALQLNVWKLSDVCVFTIANGAQLRIDRTVKRLTVWGGRECFNGDYLVAPVPHDIVLGLDWLTRHKVSWYFQSDKLRTYLDGRWCELPLVRTHMAKRTEDDNQVAPKRTAAEQVYDLLAQQVAQMTEEEATALLRSSPTRTKPRTKPGKKVPIKALIEQARANTTGLRSPLQGLNMVLALPEVDVSVALRIPEEQQGALCCAIISHANTQAKEALPTPAVDIPHATDDEDSPWPTAKLEFTLFDEWMQSSESQDLPQEIREMLQTHRHVFPDSLPPGLPPKRPHDHRILLGPGKLPTKSALYRMTPDQLRFHKQETANLAAHGWIGPTYSPICAPTIMVDKRDDGTGERQMRMVVNYQALNALTVVPDFPLPPVQTILEMLDGAKYFSTLDLEAGFHQIRMAKEDRWKTAFRSVLGLFEYKVMPFGLKGAPATFQANINADLQPLLGRGVIAYLDDVLIYSADLPTHVALLRKVLSIFLTNQFYPKFRKCQFARQELTYLGYTISAEGVKPATDKIEAIRVWPEVLENETQVR
ncbi:hypothetical protein, conserved [Eimeria praecox]|uniref:Reverse transcriptase domain-containing protein n=1 Tax=Eimeria praecox TaxID=51316 RepID=U6H953_9EIME|nr:hypothetical protein, conserved [Eimeria praecox]